MKPNIRVIGIKARLRAWLIDLVREAIRIERVADRYTVQPEGVVRFSERQVAALVPHAAKEVVTISEPSFEQMQAEALKAQEKYYEPERA